MILSLTATESQLTAGGSVTVVAIVTEPTGLENLVGGKLTSEDGLLTYGAFIATTQGTYSLTVTWDQLESVSPLSFSGSAPLTLRATFYNKAGVQTAKDVPSINLYCGSGALPDGACDGTCVQLDTIDACGACGASCTADSDAMLLATSTTSCLATAPSACSFTGTISPYQTGGATETCTAACAAATPTSATCRSAGGTTVSGAAVAVSCGDSFANFVPTATQTAEVTLFCSCEYGSFYKTTAGSCEDECPLHAGSGRPSAGPCGSTYVQLVGGAANIYDHCEAPYLYADWTHIVEPGTDSPFSVAINVRPVTITCDCEAPPTVP